MKKEFYKGRIVEYDDTVIGILDVLDFFNKHGIIDDDSDFYQKRDERMKLESIRLDAQYRLS